VKIEESIEISKHPEKHSVEELKQALKTIAKIYTIKKKITSYPNILNQKNVDKFFRFIDENGIQENFKMISIDEVRQSFKMSFIGDFEIPLFPFISEDTKKKREQIDIGN
jgi:hypothetical protein